MSTLESFLNPEFVSLKICGVTCQADGVRLAEMGVDALGVNFWSRSKRYLAPEDASWLLGLAGAILRVGVFVNEPVELPLRLFGEGYLDLVQLHGDETIDEVDAYRRAEVPFIKALGVSCEDDLAQAVDFLASGILLDAHAPGIYGGTGAIFDWELASAFRRKHPQLPVLLAGGLVPENAALAAMSVQPAALDVASGAEISPGIKDFQKVAAFLSALRHK